MLAVLAIQHWWIESRQVDTIPYSQFEEMIDAGRIRDVHVGDKYVTGTLKEAAPDGRKRFVTVRVEPMLAKRLAERGITVTGALENNRPFHARTTFSPVCAWPPVLGMISTGRPASITRRSAISNQPEIGEPGSV
jgi:hypothetical protein